MKGDLMHVRATIESLGTSRATNRVRQVTALIDPGSERSIINTTHLPTQVQDHLRRFQADPSQPNPFNIRLHRDVRISTVTSETIQDCVSLTTRIRLGDWTGDVDFLILNSFTGTSSSASIILGADFIRRHQISLNYELNNEKIDIPVQPPSSICIIANTTTIPANKELHVVVSCTRTTANQVVSIEPFDHSRQGFIVANSVNTVRNDARTFVRVANPSNHPIQLRRGQRLAQVTPIDTNSTSAPVDTRPNQATNLNDHLAQLKINPKLSSNDKQSVLEVIRRHQNAFGWTSNDLGRTDLVEHSIQLTSDKPIKIAGYKTQPHKQKVIEEKINEMLADGVIEESKSPFSSPVVLAKKKNGEWRFCVDFRALNDITVKDAYPLPRMDETLQALHGNSFFTTLDLLSGFWQIPLTPADRHKAAFVTRNGLFQFKVMPFGLTNSPATFQRLMDKVLTGLNWCKCVVYLDDIIVYGRTIHEHNDNLSLVLRQIENAKLKLKPSKCEFASEEVIYLGHRINRHGIGTDTSKVEAINRIATPTDRASLRRFLGACSFYRRFIQDFSHIAVPLYRLTSSKVEFRWTNTERLAFEKLKIALTRAPTLVAPDFSLSFVIRTDASKKPGAMGAVLEQQHGVIAYASRHYTSAEERYISEKEALAVLWASRQFRHYIYGHHVTFYTDHKPLADLKTNRLPEEPLGRLMLKLQDLDYTIKYVRGCDNTVADLLSRDVERPQSSTPPTKSSISSCRIEPQHIDWPTLQRNDSVISQVITAVKLRQQRHVTNTPYSRVFTRLHINNETLKLDERIVVPASQREQLIKSHHELFGHEQAIKLTKRLQVMHYWPKMSEDISSHVTFCDICQRAKTRHRDVPELGHIAEPELISALGFWSIDLQGTYRATRRGNRYIIVAIDYLTKWVEARCLKDCTAVSTAKFIVDRIIHRHGVPEQMKLLSDQGANFESRLIQELCELYNIKKLRSSPYHPQGNGAVERENREIKELLRSYTVSSQSDWDDYVEQVVHARNTTVHTSTSFTPFEMVYGRAIDRRPLAPLGETKSEFVDKLRLIREKIEAAAVDRLLKERRRNEKAHERRERTSFEFKIGDLVLASNEANHQGLSKKLEPKYVGPYRITGALGTRNFKCKLVSGSYEKVLHRNRLVPYHERTSAS